MPSKIYPYLLSILVLIICFQNYALGTTLMGFDSWHPEFNFSAAFDKSLSVWQEYMGLGTHGQMSFASDLSRNIVLLFFSYFLPVSFLRYLWTFGMLLLGTLGMYYFLNISIFGRDKNYSKDLSFLGALFYLFNLSTLQLFYTSFDGFITQFGFLPWLFWSGKQLLDGYSKRNVLIFLLISFFSSAQGYTGTLFFAFLIFYFLYLLWESVIYPETKKRIVNLTKIFTIYFLANFFWLAPVFYSIASGAEFVSKTTINLLSSEESFYLNQKYGDIVSILELRNFWFDSTDFNNKFGTFDPLLDEWIKHLSNSNSQYIFWILLIPLIIGFFYSLFDKKYRIFSLMFLLVVFFLTAGKEPFSVPYNFLRDNIPLLKEALRFPFTKFSILASFIYSILFALGLSFVLDRLTKFFTSYKTSERVVFLTSIIFLIIFVIRFQPYFEGKLLNPNTKVFLPEEYFRMFQFVQKKGVEERFFLAPATTFWAWPYYEFGYRGSGFVMYGLGQPTVSRSYDVWNKTNENIYWEINYALEKKDENILSNLIQKYQLKNFIIDRNIVVPGISNEERNKYFDDLQVLLEKTKLVSNKNSFGKILVIETKIDSGFVKSHQSLSSVVAFEGLKYQDSIYSNIGPYFISKKSDLSANNEKIEFPYSYLNSIRSLERGSYELNNQNQIILKSISSNNKFSISDSKILFKASLSSRELNLSNSGLGAQNIQIPLEADADLIYFDENNILDTKNNPIKNILIGLDSPISLYKSENAETYLLNEFYEGKIELDSCTENPSGSFSYQFKNGSLVLSASGNSQSLCLFSKMKKGIFSKNNPVEIRISLADKDRSVGFCLFDLQTKKCLNEGVLEKSNNFSFTFLPKFNSEDYIFYLFPQFTSLDNQTFEIGNIFVTKYDLIKKNDLSKINLNNLEFSKDMVFDLKEINVSDQAFLNICSETKGENQYVRFEGSEINFNNKRSYCLNLLEKTGYFKKNQFGYLGVLNYSLDNEKGVSICAGGSKECLTIDKLMPGKHLEKVIVIPKNSQNLRIDLVSIVSSKSVFKVNSLKIAELDIENLSSLKSNQEISKTSSKNIQNTRKLPWIYIINKNSLSSDDRLISLSQDDQPGWVAFCDSNLCNFIGDYNGYGKVWEINGYQGLVVLVYLPQILLYLGIIILAALFIRYSCKSC